MWTQCGLPSSVEIGKDGFPRPGKIVRWYRERKKQSDPMWTQKYLAQELGLTERAVCYLESQDVGLDSIALRHKLVLILDIPPIFLGLASHESPVGAGQTVYQYRKMKPKSHPLRSQKGLARALGLTETAIREMEKRNVGLDSMIRRRVLAKLLDIPPLIFGVLTLDEIETQQHPSPTTLITNAPRGKETSFDLVACTDRLKMLWTRNHTGTAQDRLTHIAAAMTELTRALPYAYGSDEKELRALLCRYHHLYAHILRDQGRYDVALEELEKAAILAERADHIHLLAVTLLRIGSVLRDRGTVFEAFAKREAARGNARGAQQHRMQAHGDYMAALDCYTRVRNLEWLPQALHGVVLFDEGY